MKELTPLDIENKLQNLPRELWRLNNIAIDLHRDFMAAEEKHENMVSMSFLKSKAGNPSMTVKELEAHSNVSCSQSRLDLIVLQAKLEKAKNDAAAYDKLLSAFQSIVKLRSSEMRSGL